MKNGIIIGIIIAVIATVAFVIFRPKKFDDLVSKIREQERT